MNEDHGDQRHLTMNDLEQAAQAADSDVQDVVDNLQDAAEQGGGHTRQTAQAGGSNRQQANSGGQRAANQ